MVLDDPERNLLAANFNGAMTYEVANHGIALRSPLNRGRSRKSGRRELSIYRIIPFGGRIKFASS
jgi:hypothetical protein